MGFTWLWGNDLHLVENVRSAETTEHDSLASYLGGGWKSCLWMPDSDICLLSRQRSWEAPEGENGGQKYNFTQFSVTSNGSDANGTAKINMKCFLGHAGTLWGLKFVCIFKEGKIHTFTKILNFLMNNIQWCLGYKCKRSVFGTTEEGRLDRNFHCHKNMPYRI